MEGAGWTGVKWHSDVQEQMYFTNLWSKVGIMHNSFNEDNFMCLNYLATKEWKASAFHETGHLIIHEIFGWKYINVLIQDSERRVRYDYQEPTEDSCLIEKVIYACICLSGKVTENRYRLLASTKELGTPIWMDGAGVDGEVSDWYKYQALRLPSEYFPLLQKFAESIIIEHWPLISKIANILSMKKKLTFEEIQPILVRYNLGGKRQSYIRNLEAISQKVELQLSNSEGDSKPQDLITEEVKNLKDFYL